MKNENQYTKYYKNHTTAELKQISANTELYEDEARLAAFLELEKRNEEFSEADKDQFDTLKHQVSKRKLTEESHKTNNKSINSSNQEKWPELYSPTAILGFTILFSVIFGGILMFLNLRRLNKKSTATIVLLATIGFLMVGGVVANFSGNNQWLILLTNVVGGIVLIEFFWKKHIGYGTSFHKKSILKPAAISLLVSLAATFLFMYLIQGNVT